MQALIDRIKQEGKVFPGNIIKVDSFINHQVDPELMLAMGKDFHAKYQEQAIEKILTIETSGIAVAVTTALQFQVPMVFAKKSEAASMDKNQYQAKVYSYTRGKTFEIRVAKDYLKAGERVLIIDDFLANGEALSGLISLCEQAGAEVAGIGIAIEKTFQPGGEKIRQAGYPIYSQARIKAFEGDTILFEEN